MTLKEIDLSHIEQSVDAIPRIFRDSLQYTSSSLSALFGVRIMLKVEIHNPVRSFKGRGTSVLIERSDPREELVCASAGNFGLAMAHACLQRKIVNTIFVAMNASPIKVARMRALGAEIIYAGRDFDEAKDAARAFSAERGARLYEDSKQAETILGAGTIGLELMNADPISSVLIPLGNGALLAGVGTALRARSPKTKLIAVQAAGAPAMVQSLRAGRCITGNTISTIADGLAVRQPIPEILPLLESLVDDTILVRDDDIVQGMQLLRLHEGIDVEPSAAVGIAALLGPSFKDRSGVVVSILCGANI